MRHMLLAVVAAAGLAGPATAQSSGRFDLELEGAYVWSGRNDVRIPGDGGTLFSLSEDLATDARPVFRLRGWWRLAERHAVGLLYAPLVLQAHGEASAPILFHGAEFAPGEPLEGRYRFDSYRLTYFYGLRRGPRFDLDLGFTLKVRDAAVRVASATTSAEKANTGPVPLLFLRARWDLTDTLTAVVEADALAAPQGRAEDVLVALEHRISPRVGLRAGYRFVEGGADNDEVYTFAWLHYATLSVRVGF